MSRLFLVAMAGAAGTLCRYLLGGWINKISNSVFPWETLLINVSGCLMIGFLGTLADEKSLLSSIQRSILFLGFLGAFTTYSSFAYETWGLMKEGTLWLAGLNVILNVFVCFAGLYLGVVFARVL